MSSGSSHRQVSLSITLTAPLRKSTNSAFRTFQSTPRTIQLASATTSGGSTPQHVKGSNVLHAAGGVGFLNELQKLQLDITDSTTTTAAGGSSNVSSASLDQSVSPADAATVSPAVDGTKLAGLKISESASGSSSDDEMNENENDEANDRARKPLHRCTLDMLDLFRTCNPAYTWSGIFQPRRVLTSPSVPSVTNPHDNANNNLIMSVGDILWHNTEDSHVYRDKLKQNNAPLKPGEKEKKKYAKSFKVMELLGEGTFGQVVKCEEIISVAGPTLAQPPALPTHSSRTKVYRAIKVIKNKPAYYNQALMEIQILKTLNEKYDPDNKHHLLRMIESFNCKGHLCLVFELLSVNLYDLMKQNGYRGLSWSLLRIFLKQILDSLSILSTAKIIHCDLKPENILLNKLTAPDITLIDFGSACFENQTVYSYIQSRFYRSPEVLVGLPYSSLIDLWSFGCIAAELYLGLPLFPGITQQNQLYRIIKFIGPPPATMLAKGKNTKKFFKIEPTGPEGNQLKYTLKTAEEYAADTHTDVAVHKTYFKGSFLKEVIDLYPMRKNLTEPQKVQELEDRKCFLHFIQGFLRWDANARWTPKQALQHPFLQRLNLSTLNEHAFEQLRYVIDQPVSIPPQISLPPPPVATTATPTNKSAPITSSSLSTASSSSALLITTPTAASSATVSAATSASTGSSFTAYVPATGMTTSPNNKTAVTLQQANQVNMNAALLSNQELAARLSQQQQQQQQQQQLSAQSQQFNHTQLQQQQQFQLQQQQQQQQPSGVGAVNAAFAGMPLSTQSSMLANAFIQQQQLQQQTPQQQSNQQYGTSPSNRSGQFIPNPSQQQQQQQFQTSQPVQIRGGGGTPQQSPTNQAPRNTPPSSRANYSTNFTNPTSQLYQQQRNSTQSSPIHQPYQTNFQPPPINYQPNQQQSQVGWNAGMTQTGSYGLPSQQPSSIAYQSTGGYPQQAGPPAYSSNTFGVMR